MLNIIKGSTIYLLAFILFGSVLTAEKNIIQTACTYNKSSFRQQQSQGCIELKQNENQLSKFIKINSQCSCTDSFLNILNQSINKYDTSIILQCETNSQVLDDSYPRLRYPQEQCQLSQECISVCEGQKLGQICGVKESLFCDPQLICDQQSNTCKYPNSYISMNSLKKDSIQKSVTNDYSNKNQSLCQSSFQCRQNEFCHFGQCLALMSLKEGQITDSQENNLFRVGNSIVDLRCKNVLAVNNECSKIHSLSSDSLVKKCSDSQECASSRRCDQLQDSSFELFKQTKYNFQSNSFCQVYPNNILFVESLKNAYINDIIEQNELCPLNLKLRSECSLIKKSLDNLNQLVQYIDNYHIINNTCIKNLKHLVNDKAVQFMNQYENQNEIILNETQSRYLQSQLDQKNEDNTNNSPKNDDQQSKDNKDSNSNDSSGGQDKGNSNNDNNTKDKEENNNNNSNNGETNNQQQEEKSDDSGSSKTAFIIVLVVILLVFGCCGAVIYVRRRNENGFASLTAQLEKDKQVMIKKGGGMMSMGSGSMNNNNNKVNANSTDSSGNIQGKQIHNDEMQIVDQKKFSKRVVNEDVRLPSQQKEVQIALKNQINNGGVELHLEQNNGNEFQDKSEKGKHHHVVHRQNHPHSNSSVPTSGIPSQQHPGPKSSSQKAQGNNSQSEKRQNPTQQQDMEQQKNLDTSVQNNFFSIDGEDEEKHDKIMDSIQLDYQSDDTTYSNVFNLEGEESSKPHSNRKKKKKQKQQNHLFFDDKNEE